LQTKSQVALFTQTAFIAFGGTGHGVHDVPHELTLSSAKQLPLQSCVFAGHMPLHAIDDGMHVPAHSFWLAGQAPPHCVPSQVAVPPVGAVHGVQDMLQLSVLVLETHAPPQR
jgi:hypothetical protein